MINYVGIEVTSKCNRNCNFCFSRNKTKKQLSYKRLCSGLDILKELGIKKVNITGGEPLLRDDVISIAMYSKKLNFHTSISTNGILIRELDNFNYAIDCLSISLDNIKKNSNLHNNFNIVKKIIKKYNSKYHNFILKVNTVVTPFNISDVSEIGRYISENCDSVRWKLIRPAERGKASKSSFTNIGSYNFQKLVKNLRNKYRNLKIFSWPLIGRKESAYFLIIENDGMIYLPHKCDYIYIGSLWDHNIRFSLNEIIKKYPKMAYENILYAEASS